MHIVYHGHACFSILTQQIHIIIDPYISDNPLAKVSIDELKADVILLTHGHSDHFGDTIALASKNNALVIAPFELANYCMMKGLRNVHAMHIGGGFQFEFGYLKLTPALHGSSVIENDNIIYTGQPCGYLLEIDGITIYHAGDTGLSQEMTLLGHCYNIDLALLPIGGNFTMDINDAIKAVRALKPNKVIPMHYNTFELIVQDPHVFAHQVENMGIECVILTAEESILL